jgi:hypothetical protein
MNKRTKKRNYRKTNKRRKNKVSFKMEAKILGGNNANFQPLYLNNPGDIIEPISSRNLPDIKGGNKLRKNKMKKTKKNKMKGGLAFNYDVFLGDNPINNSLTSLGQLGQIGLGSNILSGQGVGYDRYSFDTPRTYSYYNTPLV